MEFFNKKQDVIDIQITPFGRHLMSKGVFNPAFYSFHDDNILYNSEKGGFTEEQSKSQQRIKDTPLLKSASTFSSLEKKFAYQYGQKIFESKKFDSKSMQPTSEKMYSLWTSMGTSDLNSDPAPAVHLTFLRGNMSGSFSKTWNLQGQDGGTNIRNIPQLKADIEVMYKNISPNDDTFYEYETGAGYDFALVTPPEEAFFLIKLGEEFAPYQKENFDIEVFEIIDETEKSENFLKKLYFTEDMQEEDVLRVPIESRVENEAGDLTEQILRQLSFSQKSAENEIFSWIDETSPQDDPNYVSHYFELLVDDEIDDELICTLDPVSQIKGHFADRKT